MPALRLVVQRKEASQHTAHSPPVFRARQAGSRQSTVRSRFAFVRPARKPPASASRAPGWAISLFFLVGGGGRVIWSAGIVWGKISRGEKGGDIVSWDGCWPLSAPAAAKTRKIRQHNILGVASSRVVRWWDAGWRCDPPTLPGAMGAAYPHS